MHVTKYGLIKLHLMMIVVAQAVHGGEIPSASGNEQGNAWIIDEIVVTATKQKATLQDTPMSITVLSADSIAKRKLLSMADFLPTIPGVSFRNDSSTQQEVIIRGLKTLGTGQSTSAVYLGEMPMSNASMGAYDVKLVDIERVEVLKGPQGTLYGSSALGGIVRSIPKSPDMGKFEGHLNVDIGSQSGSNDYNRSAVAVVNAPLINDRFALRFVAYKYDNAGYVDAVSTPDLEAFAVANGATILQSEDIGGSVYEGGRATLRWQPTEKLQLTMILGKQNIESDGTNYETIGLSEYQTQYLDIGRQEGSDMEYSNLELGYDLGWATVTSSSSYVNNSGEFNQNLNSFASASWLRLSNQNLPEEVDNFSQEVRFATRMDGSLQFLVGVFYEEVDRKNQDTVTWIGSDTANPFGNRVLLSRDTVLDYQQKALFGEIYYQFDEYWQLTLGGRYFDYDRVDTTVDDETAAFSFPTVDVNLAESGNVYKINLSYTPNDDTLIYALWSEGFRLGKGQLTPIESQCDVDNNGKLDFTEADITDRVESDSTENWEFGTKFSFLENRLIVNTALFRINWDNMPMAISDTSPSCTFRTVNNIGRARSQGFELETSYRLTSNFTASLAASYLDTKWTEARPPVVNGERLTDAPLTSATLGVEYAYALGGYPAFLRTDISYVGSYETGNASLGLPSIGDYVNVGARAGIDIGRWSLALYGSNLTNENKVVNSSILTQLRMKPRVIGLSLNYTF